MPWFLFEIILGWEDVLPRQKTPINRNSFNCVKDRIGGQLPGAISGVATPGGKIRKKHEVGMSAGATPWDGTRQEGRSGMEFFRSIDSQMARYGRADSCQRKGRPSTTN
jgi:hypothetical protein